MWWGNESVSLRDLAAVTLPTDGALVVLAMRTMASRIPFSLLSEKERERFARFRFLADKERFLVAHGLKRHVCSALSGTGTARLNFAETAHGKPFLPTGGFHFNLSHSGLWVCLAFHAFDSVGIDVEEPRERSDALLEPLVFHPDDCIRGDATHRFYAAWTMKEAIAKAAGVGLMLPFSELRLEREKNGIRRGSHGGDVWQVRHGVLPNGAHLALAGREDMIRVRTVFVDV